MTASLNGSVTLSFNLTLTSDPDIGTATHVINKTYRTAFTNGTGANQGNMAWQDSGSISASSSTDFDLAGSLTDAFGTTITFTSVKGILIYSDSANGDNLSVGGDGAAPFSTIFADGSDELLIHPGGKVYLEAPGANGYVVTATTADILEITNLDSGGAATYEIILIGEI